ncbi:hypothetical protein AAMO2058_000417300 [Amorphochlora amoebiformis]
MSPAYWIGGIIGAIFVLETLSRLVRKSSASVKGKHIVITGGSTGIGFSLAKKFAALGANVTIMARTEAKLKSAVGEIKKSAKDGVRVEYKSVDVTDEKKVFSAMEYCEKTQDIAMLIMSAGQATPGYFLDQDIDQFKRHMNLNYFGSLHSVKAVAPYMTSRGNGKIVFISSAASSIPIIGYSGYTPTKCAVRGLSDVLRMEFKGFGVNVSIAYPPDTRSPGFDRENLTKPEECKTISKFGDVFEAEQVADSIVDGILAGDYHIGSPDFFQNRVINSLSAGISPRSSIVFDIILAPIWLIVGEIFCIICDYIASGYASRVKKTK